MNTEEIKKVKENFAIFEHQSELVYLDSAATSQTPNAVLDAMNDYYTQYNANIARGVYALSEKATEEYEAVRDRAQKFISAHSRDEIVFTSGTTMALNITAHGLGKINGNIVVTAMEHHANFVPWQNAAQKSGQDFRVVKITAEGKIDMDDFAKKVDANTAVLAFSYISNVLGTINPVKKLIAQAKKINPDIITVVDAAQAAPHLSIDVVDLDCDFLAFSAHKMCGPTGVGVLYGKKEKLEMFTPLFTGGEMIEEVTTEHTTYKALPHRLEAGTPHIAGVIGLGAAIRYLEEIGMDTVRTHEKNLLGYAHDKLKDTCGDDMTFFGPESIDDKSGVLSFTFKNYHPHDIAAILDQENNIAIRAGQHCAMPLHLEYLKVPATCRASFYIYNDESDIDALIAGLQKVDSILKK